MCRLGARKTLFQLAPGGVVLGGRAGELGQDDGVLGPHGGQFGGHLRLGLRTLFDAATEHGHRLRLRALQAAHLGDVALLGQFQRCLQRRLGRDDAARQLFHGAVSRPIILQNLPKRIQLRLMCSEARTPHGFPEHVRR